MIGLLGTLIPPSHAWPDEAGLLEPLPSRSHGGALHLPLLALPSYTLCQTVIIGHLGEIVSSRDNGCEQSNPLRVAALADRYRYAMDRTDAYTCWPDGYSRGVAATD